MITEDEYNRAFEALAEWEREVSDHNNKILESIGEYAFDNFDEVIRECRVSDKIEIVDNPQGENQYEESGIFKEIYVRQWSVGDSGDSFAGFIYAKFDENKWLKIPYEC